MPAVAVAATAVIATVAAAVDATVAAVVDAAVVIDDVPATIAAYADDIDAVVGEMLAGIAGKPAGAVGDAGVAGHAIADVVPWLAGLWVGGWAAASVVEAL